MEVSNLNHDVELEQSTSLTRSNADLAAIVNLVHAAANHRREDGVALLKLLRTLEALHQEVREGVFQKTLPSNRQALYSLLKDIEAEGGWPYINRMRLQALLAQLEPETDRSPHQQSSKSVE